jgi:hypothetical protein
LKDLHKNHEQVRPRISEKKDDHSLFFKVVPIFTLSMHEIKVNSIKKEDFARGS